MPKYIVEIETTRIDRIRIEAAVLDLFDNLGEQTYKWDLNIKLSEVEETLINEY